MVGEYRQKVNYSFLLNFYDENGDLANVETAFGNTVTSFESIRISYRWNQFPKFELRLSSSNWTSLINIKTFRISLYLYECHFQFESDLGVLSVEVDDGAIIYNGFMTHIDNIVVNHSRYLGDNLVEGITQIASIMKLSLDKDGEGNVANYDGKFFQFNESNVSILMKLLTGMAYKNTFSITGDNIRMIDLSFNPGTDKVLPSKTSKLMLNDNLLYTNWFNSETGEFSSYYYGKDKLISKINNNYDKNYLYNKNRYSQGLELSTITVHQNDYNGYQVGDPVIINIGSELVIFYVVGMDLDFNNIGISTTFELGTDLSKVNLAYKPIEDRVISSIE